MPKILLPNGKSVYSDKNIPDDQMDDFVASMMGQDSSVKPPTTIAPPEQHENLWDSAKRLGSSVLHGITEPFAPPANPGNIDEHSFIGKDNSLVNKIWPGGIQVPNARDLYETFIRPETSILGLGTAGAAGYLAARNRGNPNIGEFDAANTARNVTPQAIKPSPPRMLDAYAANEGTPIRPQGPGPISPLRTGQFGSAENRPYVRDIGDPRIGLANSGTVLPDEWSGLETVPPEIAAAYGINGNVPSHSVVPPENGVPPRNETLRDPIADPQPKETKLMEGTNNPEFQDVQHMAVSGKSGVKIGADVRSLGKVLGSSLYSGDITKIATKELLQNSLDAIRPMGKNGKVYVTYSDSYGENRPKWIQVQDNGKGLTKDEIQSVFTDLGSSGKRDDKNAIGGFGLAKAAPLLGGEDVDVTSIAREADGNIYMHKFGGTPDALLDGVEIRSELMPPNTPTGTTVRTYVPKDSRFWKANEIIKSIATSSSRDGEIIFDPHGDIPEEDKSEYLRGQIKRFPGRDLLGPESEITTVSNPSADFDIIVPKGTKYGPSQGVSYKLLNNGMYQGSGQFGYDDLPGIPEELMVNIRSKVPEGHQDYPFTANRENIRGSVQEAVHKYLTEHIVKPAVGNRIDQLKKIYHGMPSVQLDSKTPRGFFVYDTGNKFTSEELKNITANPAMRQLATHISDILDEVISKTYTSKTQLWGDTLKKVGFIFDQRLHGIHIPAPGEKTSAILINPMIAMDEHPPDKAASSILHTILHEAAHIPGGGHDESFTIRLGSLYGEFGGADEVSARQRIQSAIEDPEYPGEYNDAISEALHRYTESRGRPGIEDDPLLGTGIKSKSQPEGQSGVSSSVTGSRRQAIERLKTAIQSAEPIRKQQEKSYSAERSERLKDVRAVKTGGESGHYKKLGKLKGEYEKLNFTPIRETLDQTDVDHLFDVIHDNPNIMDFEKIRAGTALAKVLDGRAVPQHNEIAVLKKVFGQEVADQIVHMNAGLPIDSNRIKSLINEVANTSKALRSSFDLSAAFRQGLPMIHRKEYWDAFGQMFKYFGDDEAYQGLMDGIQKHPNYILSRNAGLFISRLGEIDEREEAFMSKIAGKVPGVSHSERAYSGFLNKLRFDTFNTMLAQAKKAKLDQYEPGIEKQIANYINVATGRGKLGRFEKNAVELNSLLFSPRFISSRLTMMNPNYYTKQHPMVRREAIKSLLAIVAFAGVATGLAKLAGADVSLDPYSADFMKSKVHNTRFDSWDSFQQYLVAAFKFLGNKSTSTTSGKTTELGSTYTAPTRLSVLTDFASNKASPLAGFAIDMLRGSDRTGNKFNLGKGVGKLFVPMIMEDTADVLMNDPSLLPLTLPATTMGISTQTYGSTKDPNAIDERIRQ